MHALLMCLSTAAVWYSVQVSQSWSCWGIQDTSTWARVGWRIYWSALVPQTHIPLIDLLKHYHSQLTLTVKPCPIPPPSLDQWWSHSQSTRPPLQLQWDRSQLTHICSEKRRRRLVFLNQHHHSNDQAGSNFSSAMMVMAMMGMAILLIRWKKDDDLSLLWANEIPRDLHSIRQPFNLLNRGNKLVSIYCLFSTMAVKTWPEPCGNRGGLNSWRALVS